MKNNSKMVTCLVMVAFSVVSYSIVAYAASWVPGANGTMVKINKMGNITNIKPFDPTQIKTPVIVAPVIAPPKIKIKNPVIVAPVIAPPKIKIKAPVVNLKGIDPSNIKVGGNGQIKIKNPMGGWTKIKAPVVDLKGIDPSNIKVGGNGQIKIKNPMGGWDKVKPPMIAPLIINDPNVRVNRMGQIKGPPLKYNGQKIKIKQGGRLLIMNGKKFIRQDVNGVAGDVIGGAMPPMSDVTGRGAADPLTLGGVDERKKPSAGIDLGGSLSTGTGGLGVDAVLGGGSRKLGPTIEGRRGGPRKEPKSADQVDAPKDQGGTPIRESNAPEADFSGANSNTNTTSHSSSSTMTDQQNSDGSQKVHLVESYESSDGSTMTIVSGVSETGEEYQTVTQTDANGEVLIEEIGDAPDDTGGTGYRLGNFYDSNVTGQELADKAEEAKNVVSQPSGDPNGGNGERPSGVPEKFGKGDVDPLTQSSMGTVFGNGDKKAKTGLRQLTNPGMGPRQGTRPNVPSRLPDRL
ncbi:MAG: hypothetical protein R8K22_06470 [Mariprofundaceae bacterium]